MKLSYYLRNSRAFTLIETMIALLILSAALILLTNSWGGSFMRVRKTQLQHEVGVLLERKMTEIILEYQDKFEDIPEDGKEDDFGSEYPKYSWKMEVRKLELPDLTTSLTSQSGGADPMLLQVVKQMTEAIGKAVKEVKISVIVKNKPKNLQFSAVTYFVDYKKDISIGPAGGPGQ